jgi:hypothetical protein
MAGRGASAGLRGGSGVMAPLRDEYVDCGARHAAAAGSAYAYAYGCAGAGGGGA